MIFGLESVHIIVLGVKESKYCKINFVLLSNMAENPKWPTKWRPKSDFVPWKSPSSLYIDCNMSNNRVFGDTEFKYRIFNLVRLSNMAENPRWRPKWRPKSDFVPWKSPSSLYIDCNMSNIGFSGTRNSNIAFSTWSDYPIWRKIQDGGQKAPKIRLCPLKVAKFIVHWL